MVTTNTMFGDPATGDRIAKALSGALKPLQNRNRGFALPSQLPAQSREAQFGSQSPAPAVAAAQSTPPAGGGAQAQVQTAAPARPVSSYNGAVGSRVDQIIAADSPLMRRAETKGFQVANQRGLGNSSMAAQAAQLSVLDAATPIATADAQDRLTRDMTADELANRLKTTEMNNVTSQNVAATGAAASMYGADKQAEISLKLAEINNRHDLTMQEKDRLAKIELAKMGFSHEVGLAEKDIAARYDLQGMDIASRYDLASMDIASRRDLASMDIEAREKLTRMGIDAQAQENAFNRAFQADQQGIELAARFDLANLDVASRERIVVTQIEAEAAQKALDRALQENLGEKEIAFRQQELDTKMAAAQQERIAAIIAEANSQRMAAYANTLGDPKMPAGARTAVQQSINDQYQQTVNYVQNLYGVSLSYATPSTAP